MSAVDIASIVRGAYDAALLEDRWDSWAFDLFGKLGGSGGLFGLLHSTEKTLERIVAFSAPARSIEEYLDGYRQFDPQIPLVSALPGSEVYVGLPGVQAQRKEIADYLRWQSDIAQMAFHQTAVMTLGDSAFRVSVCIHKSAKLGDVTRDEHRALRRLAPQLQQVFRLAFEHSEKLQSAYWDGMIVGRDGQIAFLLDERGRVMRHTDAAGVLVARRDGLDISRGRLAPLRPAEAAELHAIVARAIDPLSPGAGAMRIGRPSGKLPLTLVCYPLQRSSRMIGPLEAAALVTLIDPHDERRDPADLYRQAFRLTAREADVAAALMAGHSVETAALSLGMSMPTARTHLRSLFQKTGTSGQTGLVRLLARIG